MKILLDTLKIKINPIHGQNDHYHFIYSSKELSKNSIKVFINGYRGSSLDLCMIKFSITYICQSNHLYKHDIYNECINNMKTLIFSITNNC